MPREVREAREIRTLYFFQKRFQRTSGVQGLGGQIRSTSSGASFTGSQLCDPKHWTAGGAAEGNAFYVGPVAALSPTLCRGRG